jgi:hypothetical protein
VALWLTIYLVPFGVEHYVACFYVLMGEPGVLLPNLLNVGCLNVFLVTTIAYALFVTLYMLATIGFFLFDDFAQGFAHPYYQNRYRWIFRAGVVPVFYALALHVSGAREAITVFASMTIAIIVEILHWIAESKTTYTIVGKGVCKMKVSKRALTSVYASLAFSLVLAFAQLAYFIAFVVQNFGAVPLMTWLYGWVFFAYYFVFAIWWYATMSASTVDIRSRFILEYWWTLYDALGLLVLTAMATIGAILSS